LVVCQLDRIGRPTLDLGNLPGLPHQTVATVRVPGERHVISNEIMTSRTIVVATARQVTEKMRVNRRAG